MEMHRRIEGYTEDGKGGIRDFGVALGLTALIARLFYKSWIALVLFFPVFYFYRRYREKKRRGEEKRRLLKEFQSCMEMVSASLLAGYALENAFSDAQKELEILYGVQSPMRLELEKINRQVCMNQPLEKVFWEFAVTCEVEEIRNFSEILTFAKRSGGDLVEIIRGTVENIGSKIQIEEEIQTMIAEKKLEQKVLNVMPLFLLVYMDLTSPGYLDILYGNILGVLFMTICLAVYAAAIMISERMTRIEV